MFDQVFAGKAAVTGIFEGIFWQYMTLFVLAAIPWIELLLVIPAGVAMGLAPLPVALAVFTGNALPVFLIVFGHERWRKWRSAHPPVEKSEQVSTRNARALGIWNKYGLPGLALAGPLVTGIHLATVIALFFKPERHKLIFWMTFSLFAWTLGVVVVCYAGLEVFQYLFAQR